MKRFIAHGVDGWMSDNIIEMDEGVARVRNREHEPNSYRHTNSASKKFRCHGNATMRTAMHLFLPTTKRRGVGPEAVGQAHLKPVATVLAADRLTKRACHVTDMVCAYLDVSAAFSVLTGSHKYLTVSTIPSPWTLMRTSPKKVSTDSARVSPRTEP